MEEKLKTHAIKFAEYAMSWAVTYGVDMIFIAEEGLLDGIYQDFLDNQPRTLEAHKLNKIFNPTPNNK